MYITQHTSTQDMDPVGPGPDFRLGLQRGFIPELGSLIWVRTLRQLGRSKSIGIPTLQTVLSPAKTSIPQN